MNAEINMKNPQQSTKTNKVLMYEHLLHPLLMSANNIAIGTISKTGYNA